MKNLNLENYFIDKGINFNFNESENQYELKNNYLTNQDLNNLIKAINFFDWSICLCPDKLIVHYYKTTK